MKNLRKLRLNLSYLFVPIAIILFGVAYFYRYQPQIQFEILAFGSFLYLVLALGHHYIEKSLTFEVFIEYILIAALVVILLQSMLI